MTQYITPNFIFFSQNHHLNKGVLESINMTRERVMKDLPSSPHDCTRHIITLNDINPFTSLLMLSGLTCFAENDSVIILSNLVTEILARRFIAAKCSLICLSQKCSVAELTNSYMATNYFIDDKPKRKNSILLHQEEKKLLLNINKNKSVRALSQGFSLSEKKVSACKIKIMKKIGISRNTHLLQLINSQYLLQAMSFL